jgi:hypothetical protein
LPEKWSHIKVSGQICLILNGEVYQTTDMDELLITLLGIGAGAVGYLIATFWVQPILRYREIKYRDAADLVFFANALDLQKQDGTLREDTLQRKDSNRRCAAELNAICSSLPFWYRWMLKKQNENPIEASKDLLGLSNSSDRDEAQDLIKDVKNNLRMSEKDI